MNDIIRDLTMDRAETIRRLEELLAVLKCCTDEYHYHLKHDDESWNALPLVGTLPVPPDNNGEDQHTLELRNCPLCNSTLSRRI